jgi:hypothetical protein
MMISLMEGLYAILIVFSVEQKVSYDKDRILTVNPNNNKQLYVCQSEITVSTT